MAEERNVTVLITIPLECRDKLRQLAAEATLKNPKRQITGAGLAGRIVCSFLKRDCIDIPNIDQSLNDNSEPSSESRTKDDQTSNIGEKDHE